MEDKNESKIIYNKNGIKMTKLKENNYMLHFFIENKFLQLEKIINLEVAKLIYEINKDFLEDFHFVKNSENNATIYYLFKHFFQDFGLSQKYTYTNVSMEKTFDKIIFTTETNKEPLLKEIEFIENTEKLPISKASFVCNIISPHKVEIQNTVQFHAHYNLPEFVEKIATNIFSKIFIRIKQFIENNSFNV